MKKIQFMAICMLCILIFIVSINMFKVSTISIPKTRINCGVVVEVNPQDNSLYIEDLTGNEWVLDDMPNWRIGDIVTIHFNTNCTFMIEDDEIISINYCGHYERFNIE